ncbi:MAG: DUF87 domain-containing protein [Patescibacteria group bacterium]
MPPVVPSATGPEPELSAPPLSEEELKAAHRAPVGRTLRWLWVWWERQMKKLSDRGISAKERKALDLVFLEITGPRDSEVKADAAEQIFAALAHLHRGGMMAVQPNFSFEIVADHKHIHFVVATPKEFASLVEKQIHAAYPSAQVSEVQEYDVFQKEGYVSYAQMATTGPKYYSLKTYPDFGEVDPLNGITSALTKFAEGEAAVVQIAISPAGTDWQKQGQSLIAKAKQLEKKSPEEGGKVVLSKEAEEGIARKVSKPGHYALVRIVAVSPSAPNSQMHLQNILASLQSLSSPHSASFKPKRVWNAKHFSVDFIYRHVPRFAHWTVLSSEELATIFHLPNKFVTTPNIKWLEAKTGAAPLELPTSGVYLGKTAVRGVEQPVYLQKDDRRRHAYIIGQTGTGKSELLKNLAYQDIAAGEGVCFIDPHGDAIEDLLQMIPPERAGDVIHFDPGNTENPPGLNILEAETEEGKHLAINAFISLLYKLYDPNRTGVMGPRLERAIRNVMLTAMSEKGNTLIEVFRMLTDPTFAAGKVPLIQDPLVKRYWTDELAQTSDFHKSETLGYFASKFDRFVTEKLMRNIIGQSVSSFNFREVMDQRKILLVNLSKGKIGEENSNFLGLILVPRILAAAMSRVDVPEAQRPDFYLYVDEFQNFATPDFVQILSEARKYHLNLTVANQFIGQLDENIKNAVFGNVGTSVMFRVGADDAEYLEKQLSPYFTKSDLLNLAVGKAYLRLLINNLPSIPFALATDWEKIQAVPRNPELSGRIKGESQQRYTRPAGEVEAEIAKRAGF